MRAQTPVGCLALQLTERIGARRIFSEQSLDQEGSLAIEHDGIASSCGILGVEVSQWRLGDPFAFLNLVLETAHGVVGQTVDVLLGQEDLGLPHKHFAAARVRVENEVLLYEMDFEPAVLTQLVEVHGVSEIARDAVDILAE